MLVSINNKYILRILFFVFAFQTSYSSAQELCLIESKVNELIEIPITLNDTMTILGINLKISFNSQGLEFINADINQGILKKNSDFRINYGVIVNNSEKNHINIGISAYGIPFTGKGDFVRLIFKCIKTTETSLNISNLLCNENQVSGGFNGSTCKNITISESCDQQTHLADAICLLQEISLKKTDHQLKADTSMNNLISILNTLTGVCNQINKKKWR